MKDDIKKELTELSPLLSKLKAKQSDQEGFTVPDDFFAKMETAIWDEVKPDVSVSTEVSSKVEEPSLWETFLAQVNWLLQPQPAMAFASVMLLIVGMVWLLPNINQSQPKGLAKNTTLNTEMVDAYLAANLDDFDTETLIDWAVEEDAVDASILNDADVNSLLEEMNKENIDLNTLEQLL